MILINNQSGQENNLITLIHVPNSLKIYSYNLTTFQKVYNNDKIQVDTIALSSIYKFGLICTGISDKDFELILYFIESSIPKNQEVSLNYKDYPAEIESYGSGNTIEELNNYKNSQDDSLDMSQTQNEMSFLSQEEIDILSKQNIKPQDFLKSNKPIIKLKVSKIGKVLSIEKPLNLRYDINQVLINIVEQVTPIVSKDYYSTKAKLRVLKSTQRILQNNVPVEMHAQIESSTNGKLDKSYDDNQKTGHSNQQTTYSQSSTFKNGALQTSSISSTVSLSNVSNELDEDQGKQVFNSLRIESVGLITFVSQNDDLNVNFLRQLLEDSSNQLKLKLTWEKAQELYNQVRTTNKDSGIQELKRLLQSNYKNIIGKEINTQIFRNAYASIDFGAELYSTCVDYPQNNYIRCNNSLISFFHNSKKIINQQNITKYYSIPEFIGRSEQLTRYIKNNLVNIMGRTKQKVQKQFEAATIVLDQIISRHNSFKTSTLQKTADEISSKLLDEKQGQQKITQTFYAYHQKFLDEQRPLVQHILDNEMAKNFEQKDKVLASSEEHFSKVDAFIKDKYSRLSSLIEKIGDSKQKISSQTANTLQQLAKNFNQTLKEIVDPKLYTEIFNMTEYLSYFYITPNKKEIFAPLKNYTESSYTKKWQETIAEHSIVWNDLGEFFTDFVKINYNIFRDPSFDSYVWNATLAIGRDLNKIRDKFDSKNKNYVVELTTNSTVWVNKIQSFQVDSSLQSDEFTSDVNTLQQDIQSAVNLKPIFTPYLQKMNETMKTVPTQIQTIFNQQYESLKQMQDKGFYFYFDILKQITPPKNYLLNKLAEITPLLQKEYAQYAPIIEEAAPRVLQDIENIYNEVKDFLDNKNYPEKDPLIDQNPPNDQIFNDAMYGVSDESLKKLVDSYEDKLTLMKSFASDVQNFSANIKTSIDNFNIFMIENGNYPFIEPTKKMYQSFRLRIKKAVDAVFVPNFDTPNLNAVNSIYPKIESYIRNDVETKLVQSISQQQSQTNQKYFNVLKEIENIKDNKNPSEQKKDLGDLSMLSTNYKPLIVKNTYTYNYPTPVGVNIKLNLYVNWTSGISNTLTTERQSVKFVSISDVKADVKGVFTALIATTEIGGYADGVFIDASINSSIAANILDNHGENRAESKFGPTNVQVGQYLFTYVPKIITDCSSQEVIIKPVQNGVKQQVSSTVQAGSNSITGSAPATKCTSTVTSTSVKTNLFQPINDIGQVYQKVLVDEKY